MDSWPSDYYIWDPPDVQSQSRCKRCRRHIVVYTRCRNVSDARCTGADPLNPSVPCGLTTDRAGRPKLCEDARVISRDVDAFCAANWDHFKFTFVNHLWKCNQCHQDGQWDAMCQTCGHICDKDCTQGNLPLATREQPSFTDAERADIQEQYQALLASGHGRHFQSPHRRNPAASGATRLPSTQTSTPPSSGLVNRVPNFHGQQMNPWFTGATRHASSAQERGAGPPSGPAYQVGLTQRRDLALSRFSPASQVPTTQRHSDRLTSLSAANQPASTQGRDAGPSRSGAPDQVPGRQGRGVGPSPSVDSLQGAGASSSEAVDRSERTLRRATSIPSQARGKTPSPRKRCLSPAQRRQGKDSTSSESMEHTRAAKYPK